MNRLARVGKAQDADVCPLAHAPAPAARLAEAEDAHAHDSPARELQRRLVADWVGHEPSLEVVDRWSARRALAVIAGSSLLLWGGIGWVAVTILR